jgi:hypothetical protein
MEVKNAQSTIYKTVPISLAKGAVVNHLIVIERIYGKYATRLHVVEITVKILQIVHVNNNECQATCSTIPRTLKDICFYTLYDILYILILNIYRDYTSITTRWPTKWYIFRNLPRLASIC